MATLNHPLLTTNVDPNLTKRDVYSKVIELYPDKAKFLTVINKFGKKRPVNNPKFEMMEQDIEIFKTTLGAAIDQATTPNPTTITVATGDGVYFTANDTVILKEGTTVEQLLVTAVSGDTLTVTPSVSNSYTTAALVIKGAKAVAENGSISPSYSIEPGLIYNYVQLFDESFEISLIEANTWKYYSDAEKKARLSWERQQMMERFLRSVGRTLYFGQRGTTNVSDGMVYFTGGLDYFVTSNALDAGGAALTESDFRKFLKTVTMKGSDKRILLCSGAMVEQLSDWKLADRVVQQGSDRDKLGFKTYEYVNDYCELTVVRDMTLDRIDASLSYIIDPEYIGVAELVPMTTMKNAQNPDAYGYKEGVYWVMGLDMANEGAFGKIINLPTS